MIDILIPIAIILLMVLANGLFVAAEFAIVGAPRASIDHQAAHGNRLAQRVARILEDPQRQDRYIATTQIGISVASVGLGMYGEHILADWIAEWLAPYDDNPWIAAHAIASVSAVAILTYLHIVIGEMVPKALALQSADRTVLYVSPAIEALELAIKPLVIALNTIGNGILALVGVHRELESDRFHTPEELEFIVRESQEGGMLRGESGQILRELFEFGDLTAGEVMVPRVLLVGIPLGSEPDEVRAVVRNHLHTRYPVYSGDLDNIVGSMHIKQVLRLLITNRPVTARDARPLPYIPGPTPVDEMIAAMRRTRAQMAVVMDQHGGTAGLVTIEDLFEEVVGEIEEGRTGASLVQEAPDRIRVRGTVRLTEAGEALGLTLDHEKATTVSGLVLLLLRRPATKGDVVHWNGARFEVSAVAGRGVGQAMIVKMPPAAEPAKTKRSRTGGA